MNFDIEILKEENKIILDKDLFSKIIKEIEPLSEDELKLLNSINGNDEIKQNLSEDELKEFKKIVFRNGVKKILNKRKLKGIEKIKRKLAAKKAARKRKGKKKKATAILKLKKSLKMRNKLMKK